MFCSEDDCALRIATRQRQLWFTNQWRRPSEVYLLFWGVMSLPTKAR